MTRSPPKASKILATPIDNVEESRAQRLQRQQSRFRDRGGIFVPSSRNTLADILLGKASPLKKSRRSISASPTKGRGKSVARPLVPDTPLLRRSPRKQAKALSKCSVDDILRPGKEKVSKTLSHGNSKTPKGSSKVLKGNLESKPLEPEENVTSNRKPRITKKPVPKRTKSSKSRNVSKSTKNVNETVESGCEDVREGSLPNEDKKSNPRAKSKTKSKPETEAEPFRKQSQTSSSVTPAQLMSSRSSNRVSRSRRKSDIYSCGESEDEYVPKVSGRKSTTPKTQTKEKQSGSFKDKSTSNASIAAPPRQSKPKTGAPQLPDIMEEDEENVTVDAQASLPSKTPSVKRATSKPHSAPATNKKRPIREEVCAEMPERPQKRVKPNAKEPPTEAKSGEGRKSGSENSGNPSHLHKASKKRSHTEEQDDDREAQHHANGRKRKKVDAEMEVDEDKSKPKTPVNAAKTKTRGTSKPSAKRGTKATTRTAKRKENAVVADPKPTEQQKQSKARGLPKSVLLRIRSSAPHVVDNDPDPIDFLS